MRLEFRNLTFELGSLIRTKLDCPVPFVFTTLIQLLPTAVGFVLRRERERFGGRRDAASHSEYCFFQASRHYASCRAERGDSTPERVLGGLLTQRAGRLCRGT